MSAVELDPVFVRALRLLNSKSKDSAIQLKAMLDDAIRAKKGLGPGPSPNSPNQPKQRSRSMSKERLPSTSEREKREAEKRKDLDRLKKDLSELVGKPTESKRARMDSPVLSSDSHTPSPTPPPSRGEYDEKLVESGGNSSAEEFGDLEMNLELDCTCCVCKSFNQEISNKLMECSSCQNLFHQECHSPPVSNQEASDPRLIWNCSKCSRKSSNNSNNSSRATSVEKSSSIITSSSQKSSDKSEKSSKTSKSGRSSSSSSKHRPSPAKPDSGSALFKRVDSKSHSGSSVGSPVGMAGLAATIKTGSSKSSSRHKSSSSNHGSSSNSNSSTSSSSSAQISQAEKRIKMMKKQAAAASLSKKKPK